LGSLGPEGVRKVIDLWASRTKALGERDDVAFVLVFENRGREVGATIDHPHGQIYAYPHIPDRPARRFAAGWEPDPNPDDRFIAGNASWQAWVPYAPTFPIEVNLAPRQRVGTLIELDDEQRTDLAQLLGAVLAGLDRIYDETLPYMMWFNQAPFSSTGSTNPHSEPRAWLQIEIVSPRRSQGVSRFIASAEVACQEYFLPIAPEDVAAQLRANITI
jgi:UDPglucose--hexose-1-phosphate uridylyltransferase